MPASTPKGRIRPGCERIAEKADLLLLAGDLTRYGGPDEARVLADELGELTLPRVAVLGNHDYQADREDEVRRILGGGHPGVGGGVAHGGRRRPAGRHRRLKRLRRRVHRRLRHGLRRAGDEGVRSAYHAPGRQLEEALRSLDGVDVKIALMHYAPVEATLGSEPLEIYPFLGSYLLAEAVDKGGAHLAVHGHPHRRAEKGITPERARSRFPGTRHPP